MGNSAADESAKLPIVNSGDHARAAIAFRAGSASPLQSQRFRSCRHCKTRFRPRHGNQQICARGCRPQQLLACSRCSAEFLPCRRRQRFCSRRCAASARIAQPAPRQASGAPDLRLFLRLLKLSPFERRARGGWRFGVRMISDQIVAHLIASGRATCDGTRVFPRQQQEEANL
jgi:hypothetical protein